MSQCDHVWVPGKHGEQCEECGMMRADFDNPPEPKALKKQPKRKGVKLANSLSQATVVPHVLTSLGTLEALVADELEYMLRERKEAKTPMDFKEVKKLNLLGKTLSEANHTRIVAEEKAEKEMQDDE